MNNMKGALGNLMRQAQKVQEDMAKVQQEIAAAEITGESGAGLVKVTLNGQRQATRVQIDAAAMDEDREFLEDLVAAAINDAEQKVEAYSKEKMSGVAGGLNLPPGMNLPF